MHVEIKCKILILLCDVVSGRLVSGVLVPGVLASGILTILCEITCPMPTLHEMAAETYQVRE